MTMEKFYRLLVFGAAAANYSIAFGSYSTANTTSSTILNEGFNLGIQSSNIEKLNNKYKQNPYYDDKTPYYDDKTLNEAKDMLRSYFVEKEMEKEKEIMQSPDNYTESITRHRNKECLNYFMKGTAKGEYYGMRFFKDGTIYVGKFKKNMLSIIDFVDGFCSPNGGLERSDCDQDRVWNHSDGKERKNKIWGIAKRAKDKVQKSYNGLTNLKKGVTTAFKVINNIKKNMNPELVKKVQNLVEDPEKLTKTVEQAVKTSIKIKKTVEEIKADEGLSKNLEGVAALFTTAQGRETIKSVGTIVNAAFGENPEEQNKTFEKLRQRSKTMAENFTKPENKEIRKKIRNAITDETLVEKAGSIIKAYEKVSRPYECCKTCCKCN